MRRSASGWKALSAVRMIGEGVQESLFFTAPEFFFCAKRGLQATLAVRLLCASLPRVVDRSLGCLVGIDMIGWNYCQATPACTPSMTPMPGIFQIQLLTHTARRLDSRRWSCRCTGTLCTSCLITPQPPASLTWPLHCNVGALALDLLLLPQIQN